MLAAFENWIREQRSTFCSMGYELEITKSSMDVDNLSIRLDFDSESLIGRVTLWESGDCQLELMDIKSETTLVDRHIKMEKEIEIDEKLASFMFELE